MWVKCPNVHGLKQYKFRRLNVLQIGLGTFGTFFQNLAQPGEDEPFITWLLDTCSNKSKSLFGVGVEPVTEHVARLSPTLKELPNATLVEAAIGMRDETVKIHAVTKDFMDCCLERRHKIMTVHFEIVLNLFFI